MHTQAHVPTHTNAHMCIYHAHITHTHIQLIMMQRGQRIWEVEQKQGLVTQNSSSWYWDEVYVWKEVRCYAWLRRCRLPIIVSTHALEGDPVIKLLSITRCSCCVSCCVIVWMTRWAGGRAMSDKPGSAPPEITVAQEEQAQCLWI